MVFTGGDPGWSAADDRERNCQLRDVKDSEHLPTVSGTAGTDDEAVTVHGRTDHRDMAGRGGGCEDRRSLPQARCLGVGILQLECLVRRHGRV